MCWNGSIFAMTLIVLFIPVTISQAEQPSRAQPAAEIVLPEQLDVGIDSIPAPSSANSEQVVQDWLASRPQSAGTVDPPKYLTSLCVILTSVWLMVMVGCFGWWRCNVQRNNQDT